MVYTDRPTSALLLLLMKSLILWTAWLQREAGQCGEFNEGRQGITATVWTSDLLWVWARFSGTSMWSVSRRQLLWPSSRSFNFHD